MATAKGIQHEYISELEKTTQIIRALKGLKDEDKNWKPHEKSMSIKALADHVVELQTWFNNAIKNDSFDLATDFVPLNYDSFEELNQILKERVEANMEFINSVEEDFWFENFTFKKGDYVIVKLPRIAFLRSVLTNHFIHHRGQLSVYLRLLNIPVPGIYGPSADEK